jgi:hypothetical protein
LYVGTRNIRKEFPSAFFSFFFHRLLDPFLQLVLKRMKAITIVVYLNAAPLVSAAFLSRPD